MPVTEDQVEKLYKKMLIPLGVIYTDFISSGRGPTGEGAGLREPKIKSLENRSFSEIPLKFAPIMGHQPGIFLGDLDTEKFMYESFSTTRTCVIINVKEINKFAPDITKNGVALLLAHELGHAYRWYMGHPGGTTGYTNEVWARTLELAYVEGLRKSIVTDHVGTNFRDTVNFIKKYRKSLYKSSVGEKAFYTELTGDAEWTIEAASTKSQCPGGDPKCFRPPHIACKPN